MKPDKHQRGEQRCQYLGWRVRDPAQPFVLLLYTMNEVSKQHVYGVNNYCLLCAIKAKQANKNVQLCRVS